MIQNSLNFHASVAAYFVLPSFIFILFFTHIYFPSYQNAITKH